MKQTAHPTLQLLPNQLKKTKQKTDRFRLLRETPENLTTRIFNYQQ